MPDTSCPKCGRTFPLCTPLAKMLQHTRGCGRTRKRTPADSPPEQHRVPPRVPPRLPFSFEVPLLIASQNQTQYAHWSRYRGYKQKWYKAIPLLSGPIHGILLPWSRWEICRLYTGRRRELDYGNLVGGCKPLPDALIRIGAIPDDAPRHFECTYTQTRSERDAVIITLLEYVDAAPNEL